MIYTLILAIHGYYSNTRVDKILLFLLLFLLLFFHQKKEKKNKGSNYTLISKTYNQPTSKTDPATIVSSESTTTEPYIFAQFQKKEKKKNPRNAQI